MTLKTLKDLNTYENSEFYDLVLKSDIKAEAIKWVKYFNSKEFSIPMLLQQGEFFNEDQLEILRQLIDKQAKKDLTRQFMKFHNITEEDLEDEFFSEGAHIKIKSRLKGGDEDE